MALSPELRALLETLVGLGYVEQVEIESDRDILFTRTVVAERVAAVHWYPPAGPGGGDAFWVDDGTNLRPVTGGRGINLGTGDIIADIATLNRLNIDAVGDLAVAGSQLRIEGPNGVEIVGLELQPIGTILPQAGMLQWTGTAFQLYDGTHWITVAGVDPGGGGDGIGYWLDSVANNELHTLVPGRNVRIDGGSKLILNPARDAWLAAGSTAFSIGMPNDGIHFYDWVNREIAHLTATGQLALYPAGSAPPILERLHVVGGLVVGAAASVAVGTIQYAGGHFQGRNATAWVNLDSAADPPGSVTNPLVPTGVVPGVYGDPLNIPVLDVRVDGRVYVASETPLTPGTLSTALGGVGGDLHGTWPALYLNDIVPPVPAGLYGDATHYPVVTVDTKGRVTAASTLEIRVANDPMLPSTAFVTDLSAVHINQFRILMSLTFTPTATGVGIINGSLQGRLNRGNLIDNTLAPAWIQLWVELDGVEVHRIIRGPNWLLADGTGDRFTEAIEIPFNFGWAGIAINTSHMFTVKMSNFNNGTQTVDPVSNGLDYLPEFGEFTVLEQPRSGIGRTSATYLLAGALVGPAAVGTIGSWVASQAFTLPASLGGSQASCKVAVGGTVDLLIQVNGVSKGSIHWAAGATVATFTFPADVPVSPGDRVEVIGAAGVSDPTWTLRGLL